MYRTLQKSILVRVQAILRDKYQIELAQLAVEQPPKIELGEFALPVAFELAKRLKKAPRAIAAELQAELAGMDGVASVEVAGAGYLNIKVDRGAMARKIASGGVVAAAEAQVSEARPGAPGFVDSPKTIVDVETQPAAEHVLVEHTSINPNKAAHVGHLRNAILGDTFARLLRAAGFAVGVQNYIDNTGVQVADVVVGLVHLEDKTLEDVRELMAQLLEMNQRADYYCWDLYARVSRWYEEEPEQAAARKKLRLDTLHALEQGGNETSEIAELVATAVLRRHLETMGRLGIEYDFLPRESEILLLHFWDAAFELMKHRGVLYLETEGKNKGCWVMRRAAAAGETQIPSFARNDNQGKGDDGGGAPDEDAKVIVRSNGTVTYVGKDIAYHLWKFGLLPGKDFGYHLFKAYPPSALSPEGHPCWISAMRSDPDIFPPRFGNADAIYNVIDSRQADPQSNVIEALRGMGYAAQADRYTHLNYEMVALTPRCAMELGYAVSAEDQGRAYIEVSGRKGFGVKADDLMDRMIAAAKAEVDARHPELSDAERLEIATKIAVGALRYFMLKYTRNTVIAFDFKDALSFEGETGPYAQYAVVRAANIFRKAGVGEREALDAAAGMDSGAYLDGADGASIWEVWLMASKASLALEQSVATAEPAYVARYAFQLAQMFSNFYHRHHILNETDAGKKALLLATVAVAKRELERALGWMGIEAPSVM